MTDLSPPDGAAPRAGTEFDFILYPIDRSTFLRDHFHQRALHIPGPRNKFAWLGFDVSSVFDAAIRFASEPALATIDDWPTRCRLQTPATGELVVEGHQVAQLAKLPDATICIDRIDRLDGALARFVTQFSKCTASDVGINCYYSAEGAGFPIHYDDHPVFIVQISGCKKWQFSREPYRRAPPENFIVPADHRHDYPGEEELQSVLLEPGDVLFLPAGTLHQGKGVGHSLALTIAFRSKVFPRNLIGLLKEVDAAWVYEPLPLVADSERSEHPPDEVVADLEQRLTAFREWAASLKPVDVWHYWLKDCAARPTVAPTAQLIELREDTELEVASEFPVDVNVKPENGTTHVHITYGHQTMEFDCSPRSAALLESLLKRERFKPSELQVPFAAIRGVLRLLLEFGVIHAAQGHSA